MKKIIIFTILGIIFFAVYGTLYHFNIIEHKAYSSEYFNIEVYTSSTDTDSDGVDDQTDILNSAKAYIETKPLYKNKYYASGYPDDHFGVCTDVIGFALLNSGFDIMNLLNEDVKNNRDLYDIEVIDKNIDFRRVQNLRIYFERHFEVLTTDISKIEEWQGGDIIVFEKHIGIISDKRNIYGVPFLIHLGSRYQFRLEEDILQHRDDITGHYRVQAN